VFPADLPGNLHEKIASFVCSFLNHIGIMNGPSHTEVKVENDDIYIIETHNRVGGDSIANLVEMTTGFNMFQYMIGWPAGIITDKDVPVDYMGTASIYFLFSTKGRIDSISGVDSSKTVPGITNLTMYKAAGDAVEQTSSSFNRLGQIIAHADSRRSCLEAFDKVLERLKIIIK
jgi:biotin carboxylase